MSKSAEISDSCRMDSTFWTITDETGKIETIDGSEMSGKKIFLQLVDFVREMS